jgi:NADH-quinone oxidoreductase subunit M
MNQMHLPWIEAAVLVPVIGALWVGRIRDAEFARRHSLLFAGLALACTVGAWVDFHTVNAPLAGDRETLAARSLGPDWFVLDELSAPLLPMAALLYFLVPLMTLRTKRRRFFFASTLGSEAILLAMLSCREPWGIIVLLAVRTLHPYLELRARGKPTRVFVSHMALFVIALAAGWGLLQAGGPPSLAVALILLGIFTRVGIAPLHCWLPDLFEHATFGTSLLFLTPMAGTYAAVRLLFPIAPDWALRVVVLMSLATAVYAAGMTLIQRDARRFFCFLFLSHSAMVLVGLDVATPISLTGALSVWLSVGLALAGFGLTLRSIEARTGRLSLADFQGLYDHMPTLAAFFLLTGLASVGFPGTFGFVGTELLVDGTVQASPYVGMAVVLAAALNGIAVLQAYFTVFTGKRHVTSVSLRRRRCEQIAVLVLAALILGGGFVPEPGVVSRHAAASALLEERAERLAPGRSAREPRLTSDIPEEHN